MIFIVSVAYYIIATVISYLIAKKDYKRFIKNKGPKLTIISVIIISLLYGLFNIIATKTSSVIGGDRQNYIYDYTGVRSSSSDGLNLVISFFNIFTNDYLVFFYASTIIVVFITLLAYRISEHTTPKTLLFLLCTQYVSFTLSVLKQSYANAFAALSISVALNEKTTKNKILCAIFVYLSILFHHTAFILIPICIILCKKQRKRSLYFYLTAIILFIIFLEPILTITSNISSHIAPVISVKINSYLLENATESGLRPENLTTAIKGIPFYVLTIAGFMSRKKLLKEQTRYDDLLFLCSILSVSYLLTVFNGWIYRFSYIFLLSAGMLYTYIRSTLNKKTNICIFSILTIGILSYLTIRYIALSFLLYGGI